ncbi:MAG: flagellar hook associated protein [Bdellovibrio sp. CG10_big_fil_rev_8_21_14_0_10_47_8]|nr:MAG: flagellar hook associated protein [Bdellovibrio sp. CG10_big_fil_rev_8_21_14_0_10_47_8]
MKEESLGAIRFSGMASGLPPNIVEQIIEAERIPVKTMEAQKAKEDDKLKLVTDLESKISDITKNIADMVGIRGFMNNKLTSADPGIIDGLVDPNNATTGEWHIEVMQLAEKPGAVSNGFADKDQTQIGVGYMRFDTPEGRKDVYVNNNNSTLSGIAAAINSAGYGLQATVLNDRSDKETPYRLLVTGMTTGDDNQVAFPTIYMLDGDQDVYFDVARPAQNAKIKVDGFELEVTENSVNDVIPGVTLDLKQASPGRPIRISVKEDAEVISGKMKSFVEAYNGALGFIQGQHKLQKGQDGKERLGPLGGDGLIRSIESNLRRVLLNPQMGVDSNIKRVADMGIEFSRNGTLNFSQDKFNKVLAANPKAVSNFLRGDGFSTGFIPAVRREISNLLDSSFGPISNRKRGIQQKIDSVNQRIENKERQLTRREETLRRQFSDLESKMSKLQSQGAAVAGIGGMQVKQS